MLTLSNAPLHQPVEITDIQADASFTDHLYTLGLMPGETVQLFAKVALGGPVALMLRGSRLALRREDAACIGVRPLAL